MISSFLIITILYPHPHRNYHLLRFLVWCSPSFTPPCVPSSTQPPTKPITLKLHEYLRIPHFDIDLSGVISLYLKTTPTDFQCRLPFP
ncbi:hypothetical protein EDD18DRAFT_1470538 [Armillaria luteobubalina]|uniref:Uncharacterized protein n=1 Tax=Armillaria luteobubalina TaxID=153913 RepID=A0AA39NZY5_9AGAR|nr:hypothetical protein EDD18DRAFT_1470538 [Armillaria luteobubalina]